MCVCGRSVGRAWLYAALNDGCLRNVSLRIRSTHMPPSDTLLHTGDLLTAVYCVVSGTLEVVTADDVLIAVLSPGDFFGGLPPLAVSSSGRRGAAGCCDTTEGSPSYPFTPPPKSCFAVRALTYADVQFVDRCDLADVCSVYAELPCQLLEHFELAIPLASSGHRHHSVGTNEVRCVCVCVRQSFIPLLCCGHPGSILSPRCCCWWWWFAV